MKSVTVTTGNQSEVQRLARFLFQELSDEDLRVLLKELLDDVSNYQKVVEVLQSYNPEEEL